jgi:chorismate synthase
MLRFLTAGESHGPELTMILEGMPAGLALQGEDLKEDLARRQKSEGSGGRMLIEQDQARITAGVMGGATTGAPIAAIIMNKDFPSWRNRQVPPMTIPRPGHVDLNAAIKYGYEDLRLGLERASARETAARTAAGAICRKFLKEFGIVVGSYVRSIGPVGADIPEPPDYPQLFALAEADPVRCPCETASKHMVQAIREARIKEDTLGGVFDCVALNVPPGLGSHVSWDRRLSARLIGAMASIPAIKGVQFGSAFENTTKTGTNVHDAIELDSQGNLTRSSNSAGGMEGGITTGLPIVIQAAMKPISTTMKGIRSVDLASGADVTNAYERSDICAVPRAAVVGEAMMAFVLADALLEKLGGDSMKEMLARFKDLKRNALSDVPMRNQPWNFGYD